ncbi:MAG: GNAT family N-acetyltransferase [Gammaproteobacteria bacterium]|nr:GNAT family N-acetyltransferase [Gammaproteobacteria bacterium]NVK89621.1 GNAT family N-acetyltransferase [Gammaproteobacteria bacterium]
MDIRLGHLEHPAVLALLQEHLNDMYKTSPKESVHALDMDGLNNPAIRFYTVWHAEQLLGCGAIKRHDHALCEVKSMRVAKAFQRQGVARKLLARMLDDARCEGYRVVALETGSQPFFAAAHALYRRFGFLECAPFADYRLDPNSCFMQLTL